MTTYPLWLKLLVAFGAPASAAFASTFPVTNDLVTGIVTAVAAGFGGMAALGINDQAKDVVERGERKEK